MLHLLCTKKGMGMVEVLIAFFITSIGIMALLSLQPTGWKTMAKSDYVGRASGILYKTLEDQENLILNPCNCITMGTTATNVKSSDQTAIIPGDITYTVTTTTALDANTTSHQAVVDVTVQVSWPPLNSKGISDTMIVARQEGCRWPTGCLNCAPP